MCRLVEVLLAHHADPNAHAGEIDGGVTPLILAAWTRRLPVMDLLIKAGARVDERDDNGETALIWAADTGGIESVRRLLAAGADPTLTGTPGRTALEYARSGRIHRYRRIALRREAPSAALVSVLMVPVPSGHEILAFAAAAAKTSR